MSVPQLGGVFPLAVGRCLLGTAPSSEVMTQGEMTEQLWFVVDKGSFGPQKLKVKPDSHTESSIEDGCYVDGLSSPLLPRVSKGFSGELCT